MKETLTLGDRVRNKNTPFIYIQGPNKYMDNENIEQYSFNGLNKASDQIVEKLSPYVNTYDMRSIFMNDKELDIDIKNVFLHTDLHMTTEAEIAAAQYIAEILRKDFGINIVNNEMLDVSSDNYEIEHHKMLGNYGRNVGKYYVPIDDFMLFWPKNETHFKKTIMLTGEEQKGSFKEICLNGYEKMEHDEYTYWLLII